MTSKTVIPDVNIETWKSLYGEAFKLEEQAPWNEIRDNQLFAVRDPATDTIGYCCVMGALGEYFGLAVYRGTQGLTCYKKILNGEYDGNKIESLIENNCLLTEFCHHVDELEQEDLTVFKSIGRADTGQESIPCFRSILPGCYPWYLTEEEAVYLAFVLKCSLDFVERFRSGETLPDDEKKILLYELKNGTLDVGTAVLPDNHPVSLPKYHIDDKEIDKVLGLSLSHEGIWEVDTVVLSGMIVDSDRPYAPQATLFVDKNTSTIVSMEMCSREQNVYLKLCSELLKSIEKHDLLPEKMIFSNLLTREVVKPLAEKLNIKIETSDRLPDVENVKEFLSKNRV